MKLLKAYDPLKESMVFRFVEDDTPEPEWVVSYRGFSHQDIEPLQAAIEEFRLVSEQKGT